MWSRFGTTPHFGSNSFGLIFSLSHFSTLPPPSHPPRLWKHLYGQAKPSSSVGLWQGVWALHAGRAGADATPPQLFTNRGGGIGLASHVSAFLSSYPPPSQLNFHAQNHNNCPQVAFSRHPVKPGSRLNNTSDSFWTWRGGRGVLGLVWISFTSKRKNEVI